MVVFYRGDVLGCGLYSHGKLVSQIPKERRMTSNTIEQGLPSNKCGPDVKLGESENPDNFRCLGD